MDKNDIAIQCEEFYTLLLHLCYILINVQNLIVLQKEPSIRLVLSPTIRALAHMLGFVKIASSSSEDEEQEFPAPQPGKSRINGIGLYHKKYLHKIPAEWSYVNAGLTHRHLDIPTAAQQKQRSVFQLFCIQGFIDNGLDAMIHLLPLTRLVSLAVCNDILAFLGYLRTYVSLSNVRNVYQSLPKALLSWSEMIDENTFDRRANRIHWQEFVRNLTYLYQNSALFSSEIFPPEHSLKIKLNVIDKLLNHSFIQLRAEGLSYLCTLIDTVRGQKNPSSDQDGYKMTTYSRQKRKNLKNNAMAANSRSEQDQALLTSWIIQKGVLLQLSTDQSTMEKLSPLLEFLVNREAITCNGTGKDKNKFDLGDMWRQVTQSFSTLLSAFREILLHLVRKLSPTMCVELWEMMEEEFRKHANAIDDKTLDFIQKFSLEAKMNSKGSKKSEDCWYGFDLLLDIALGRKDMNRCTLNSLALKRVQQLLLNKHFTAKWFVAMTECFDWIALTMETGGNENLDLDDMFDFINVIFSHYRYLKSFLSPQLSFVNVLNKLDQHCINDLEGLSLIKILLSQLKYTGRRRIKTTETASRTNTDMQHIPQLIESRLNLIEIVLSESHDSKLDHDLIRDLFNAVYSITTDPTVQNLCANSLIAWIGRCIPSANNSQLGIFRDISSLHTLLVDFLYVPANKMHAQRFDTWFKCFIFVGCYKSHFRYNVNKAKMFPFSEVNDLVIHYKPNNINAREFKQYHNLWDFALHGFDYYVLESAIRTIVQLHAGFEGERADVPPSGIQILLDKCIQRFNNVNSTNPEEKANQQQKISDLTSVENLRHALMIRKCLELPLGITCFGGEHLKSKNNRSVSVCIKPVMPNNNPKNDYGKALILEVPNKISVEEMLKQYIGLDNKKNKRDPLRTSLLKAIEDEVLELYQVPEEHLDKNEILSRKYRVPRPMWPYVHVGDLLNAKNTLQESLTLVVRVIPNKKNSEQGYHYISMYFDSRMFDKDGKSFSSIYDALNHSNANINLFAYHLLRSLECPKSIREKIGGNYWVRRAKDVQLWTEYFSCGKNPKKNTDHKHIQSFYHCSVLYQILNRKNPTPEESSEMSRANINLIHHQVWPLLIQQWMMEFGNPKIFEAQAPIMRLYWIRHLTIVCKLLKHTQIPSPDNERNNNNERQVTVTPLEYYVLQSNDTKLEELVISALTTNFWLILTDRYPQNVQAAYELTAMDEIDQVLTESFQEVVDTLVLVLKRAGTKENAQGHWDSFFETFSARDKQVLKDLFLGEKRLLRRALRAQIMKFRVEKDKYSPKLSRAITTFLTDTKITQNPDLNISKDYYELCAELASHTNDDKLKPELCDAIFQTLHATNQNSRSKTSDKLHECISYLLQTLIDLVKRCGVKNEYITIVFEDCLFGRQRSSNSNELNKSSNGNPVENQYLCSEENLRGKAFQLLSALLMASDNCNTDDSNETPTQHFLSKLVEHLDIRPHVNEQWKDMSSCCRREFFVGLENLGSTCYLNSIIQNLFMIPSFSNRILQFPYAIQQGSLLHQMQKLFLMLSKSQRQMMNPKDFIDTVRTPTGEEIDITEHMDCSEMIMQVFGQLEEQLNTLEEDTSVLDQMQMKLNYATTCEACHTTRNKKETARVLALDATDVKSLNEGLHKFVEAERLHGDNAVTCEICQSKQNCQRRQTILEPPKILFISLKRFRFDVTRQMREKLNHYINFPTELDISEYLTSHLEESWANNEYNDNRNESNPMFYMYDLVGVIIHSGSATKGHYYTYIKDRKTREWFEFNDVKVTKFDFQKIKEEAFGGAANGGNTQEEETDKSNAVTNQNTSTPNAWGNKGGRAKRKAVNIEDKIQVATLKEHNAYILVYEQRENRDSEDRSSRNAGTAKETFDSTLKENEKKNETVDASEIEEKKLEENAITEENLEKNNKEISDGDHSLNEKRRGDDEKHGERSNKNTDTDKQTATGSVFDHDSLQREDMEGIERENLKIFRQENVYNTHFDQFMFDYMTRCIANIKEEEKKNEERNSKLHALVSKVLLRHVLNVVPGLIENKRKKEWFTMLTDIYTTNISLVEDLINNDDIVPWILNLCTKCPQSDTRTYALSFFQTIFKDLHNKALNKTIIPTLCNKLCEVVKYISPYDMPLKDTDDNKSALAHEFFILLKNQTPQSVYFPHFHENKLIHELVKLSCRDNRYIRYQWLPPEVHLLDSKLFSLHYDILFELIRNLLEYEKRYNLDAKKQHSDKNQEIVSHSANTNENYEDNDIKNEDQSNISVSGASSVSVDLDELSLSSTPWEMVGSKPFLQCLVARKCDNNKHQLKLVYLIGENNIPSSKKLTECVVQRVEKLDNFDCFSAVQCFMELMSIDDKCKQERWNECFKMFIDCVKKDNFGQSWHMVEMCIVLLLDLFTRKHEVFEWFCNSKEGIEFIDWMQTYAEEFSTLKKVNQIINEGGDAPKPYKYDMPRSIDKSIPIDKIPCYKGKQRNLQIVVQEVLTSLKQK